MIACSKDRSINITYLEAPLEKVWWSVSSPEGMNSYLTYTAEKTGEPDRIEAGETYTLCYGDILNHPVVVEADYLKTFAVQDTYESIAPDGSTDQFLVTTRFDLVQEGEFVKLTLTVTGFADDTHGQWFRECLEMGWRRSLMNLKCVLELGMDLRVSLFSYPRLGVVNCTVNQEQSEESGVEVGAGNYLLEVFPNSPAYRAELKKGDVIVSFDGRPTRDYSEFVRVISSYHDKSADVKVSFIRDKQVRETVAHLSLEETFIGKVDLEGTSFDEVKEKREMLAKQRSASGSLWQQTDEGDEQA